MNKPRRKTFRTTKLDYAKIKFHIAFNKIKSGGDKMAVIRWAEEAGKLSLEACRECNLSIYGGI